MMSVNEGRKTLTVFENIDVRVFQAKWQPLSYEYAAHLVEMRKATGNQPNSRQAAAALELVCEYKQSWKAKPDRKKQKATHCQV